MATLWMLGAIVWPIVSWLIARHYGVSALRPVLLALVIGPLGPILAVRNGREHRRTVAAQRLIDALHPLPAPHVTPTPSSITSTTTRYTTR